MTRHWWRCRRETMPSIPDDAAERHRAHQEAVERLVETIEQRRQIKGLTGLLADPDAVDHYITRLEHSYGKESNS